MKDSVRINSAFLLKLFEIWRKEGDFFVASLCCHSFKISVVLFFKCLPLEYTSLTLVFTSVRFLRTHSVGHTRGLLQSLLKGDAHGAFVADNSRA